MRQDRTKRQALGVEQKSISRRELSAAKSEGKMRARSLCGCWAAFFFLVGMKVVFASDSS